MREMMEYLLSQKLSPLTDADISMFLYHNIKMGAAKSIARLLEGGRSNAFFEEGKLPKAIVKLLNSGDHIDLIVILKNEVRVMGAWGDEFTIIGRNSSNEKVRELFNV